MDLPILLLTVWGALGVAVACAFAARESGDAPRRDMTVAGAEAALFAAVVIRLALLWTIERNGFVIFTIDEAIRAEFSWKWARDPFFLTHWAGIWLTGRWA